jgi:hypothetical protein
MICKDIVVLDVLIDVYVIPFLYACSDQTSMLWLMKGNMCIRWSNLIVILGMRQQYFMYYSF